VRLTVGRRQAAAHKPLAWVPATDELARQRAPDATGAPGAAAGSRCGETGLTTTEPRASGASHARAVEPASSYVEEPAAPALGSSRVGATSPRRWWSRPPRPDMAGGLAHRAVAGPVPLAPRPTAPRHGCLLHCPSVLQACNCHLLLHVILRLQFLQFRVKILFLSNVLRIIQHAIYPLLRTLLFPFLCVL